MAFAIGLLVVSIGAIVAGAGYIRTANRMRSFATTRGAVLAKEVGTVPSGDRRDGRWGKGGGAVPKVTYRYAVGGVEYTNDRWGYAWRGTRRSLVEAQLARIPDEVDVHYDPARPAESYLELHTPNTGTYLVAGGIAGGVLAMFVLLVLILA
ncbi:MAG TPA: DUF3592 domain-containing protein [Solirubrobacter sp.]|nr:DUF3592 domain-containing protein [Solirubrobacter sp.]